MMVGDDHDEEVIYAASISGGADYLNEMPRRLTLVRKFADGREIRAEYRYYGREEGPVLEEQNGRPDNQ